MSKLTKNRPIPNRERTSQRRFQKLILSLVMLVIMMPFITAHTNAYTGCETTSGDCNISIPLVNQPTV